MTLANADQNVPERLVDAARACLLETGYAKLATRRVAEVAGVPLSQIHYHFGGKQGLVLAVLQAQNSRLLERQTAMFAQDQPLWRRWDEACDFLDEDLESGYVRILQEMLAAGWANEDVAQAMRAVMRGWMGLLATVAEEVAPFLGPFTPTEVSALVSAAFMGTESLLLAGFEEPLFPIKTALRKVGELIRQAEAWDRR